MREMLYMTHVGDNVIKLFFLAKRVIKQLKDMKS